MSSYVNQLRNEKKKEQCINLIPCEGEIGESSLDFLAHGFPISDVRTGQTCPWHCCWDSPLRSRLQWTTIRCLVEGESCLCVLKKVALLPKAVSVAECFRTSLKKNFSLSEKIPLVLNKYSSSHLWSLPPWSQCVIEMWFPYYYRIIFQLPRLVWISYIVKISVDNLLRRNWWNAQEMHSLS